MECREAGDRLAAAGLMLPGDGNPGFKLWDPVVASLAAGAFQLLLQLAQAKARFLEEHETIVIERSASIDLVGLTGSVGQLGSTLPVESAVKHLVPHQIFEERQKVLRRPGGVGDHL